MSSEAISAPSLREVRSALDRWPWVKSNYRSVEDHCCQRGPEALDKETLCEQIVFRRSWNDLWEIVEQMTVQLFYVLLDFHSLCIKENLPDIRMDQMPSV